MALFDSSSHEQGGALLVALALLALAAALLAGSAQAARAIVRSAQSHGASVTAESESRLALAEFLSAWSSSYDSLQIGGSSQTDIGPRRLSGAGLMASARVRVMRLSEDRYVVGIESSIGAAGVNIARRRLSLVIERPPGSDTLAGRAQPAPIARWSLADLF